MLDVINRSCSCLRWIKVLMFMLFVQGTAPTFSRYSGGNYLEEDKYSPGFLTLGQKYSIALGSTVVLPCKINETERSAQYVLAWKRGIAILTAGTLKVTVNPRIRLMPMVQGQPGYNLEIRDVHIGDAGDYMCQIGTMEVKEIVHTLEVLVPAKIDYIAPAHPVEVHKGARVRLECKGTGNPTPRIIWSRRNKLLPTGDANLTESVFEMLHVNRHSSGHYLCTADNRVGQPDVREFTVNVLHSPEVEVEHPTVHSGVGYEAQLTCVVHSEPTANVVWLKEGTELDTNARHHSQSVNGNKHSLLIRNVTRYDLGNYTCQASNHLGTDRGTLHLSGLPSICHFDSPTASNDRDQYNITWTVESHSPIEEYRLFYRLHSPSRHSLENRIFSHSDYALYSATGYNTGGYFGDEPWETVSIPELVDNGFGAYGRGLYYNNPYSYQPEVVHRASFQLKKLRSGSSYEARVQARNEYGWNQLSSLFQFSTRTEDPEVEPSPQPAVYGIGLLEKSRMIFGGGAAKSNINKLSIFCICILGFLAQIIAMMTSQYLLF
ncbi:leucine-rich repeats and immunoglobulin-like domains protein 1 [Aedes aegypti]|uniref:Ig-like domain-containing protein n=1 Tax=Aedes aegypti TaxID=7159 RepID=A0A6I8TDU6_AEDAE|nr:leucine-rich repeats and immunoglobulin-like domains protein 1 [Aedes aegypti]XP_021708127.1 leucine-rich repeats and immunoglobulin-like domains protein 1 [Aedes aegypti]XP_021708128.1 leucine-rich repeats and immunoglobulin-like domains protein 1 [Aedes aegypti]XP_021708129.1 leucine-rich repeats and immunoglobulin-like domains protein 1 [Aedes aegypti]XP_021708130.1 leucine-rich repeats and immunoglobulin-like domains protein 1 [Aedes aegypti]XP_021708131.1 leucine-rich repeats and immun